MNKKRVSIIGGGAWGRALFFALSKNNSNITITSATNRVLGIEGESDLESALRGEYLIFAISAQHTNEWLEKNFSFKNQKVLVASKGIDARSGEFLNSIYKRYIDSQNLAFLSGPSFAKEIVHSLPCALVIHSKNSKLSKKLQRLFPPFIKTYTSGDIVGGEIAGAYKNVIAIAGGICDGLSLGNNAKASLVSRGLIEMARFGRHFGAKNKTFLGLSGAGDLFLTSSSTLSRNYRVGYSLASGKTLDMVLDELGEVAEGVESAKAVVLLSKREKIYTPIANEVALITAGKSPKDSLRDLLAHKKG